MTPDLLVIGDLHLKTPIVQAHVKHVLHTRPSIRKTVFLGDLNDDWNTTSNDRVSRMEAFLQLLEDLQSQDLDTVVLLGNHDVSYLPQVDSTSLTFRNASPGHDHTAEPAIRKIMASIPDPKIAELITIGGRPTVLTHAGLTSSWIMKHTPDVGEDPQAVVGRLNQMLHDGDWNALYSIGKARGGLWTSIPSPLWADDTELVHDPAQGFDQIVGHSPVSTIVTVHAYDPIDPYGPSHGHDDQASMGSKPGDLQEDAHQGSGVLDTYGAQDGDGDPSPIDQRLTFCDTMSCSSDGDPIGDGSLLMIDTATGSMAKTTPDGSTHEVQEVDVDLTDLKGRPWSIWRAWAG